MPRVYRKKLAVLIPAHNEELVMDATITSAINAGMKKRDIYVVDDASTDLTAAIARVRLGADHVLQVERSGKAGAVKQAIESFGICEHYTWLHVADADSLFGSDYFRIFRRALNPRKFVAATGYVRSLQGCWISKFRVYEYTWGLDVIRRMQAWFGVITVIPGSDVLPAHRYYPPPRF